MISIVHNTITIAEVVINRIKEGRDNLGVLYDKRIQSKLRENFYDSCMTCHALPGSNVLQLRNNKSKKIYHK